MNIFEITPDLQKKIDVIIGFYGDTDPTLDFNKIVTKAINKYCDAKIVEKENRINIKLIRSRLFKKQNGKCHYCNKQLSHTKSTIDHIIPRSKGGTDTIDNFVVACYECNCDKSDLNREEYAEYKLNYQ